jgi:hypothetical protein
MRKPEVEKKHIIKNLTSELCCYKKSSQLSLKITSHNNWDNTFKDMKVTL